ncbi:unnamed protein product [Phytophthora fragariaefolia]|uniref:Unnamed protein product n=1 Tax=Phytophthora fragariaefolia TaxID=1490495 RepID=A0A9W6XJW7_9STRA|nr:unnamed protein product [Phytophthora fragariaefolia]
MLLVRPKLIRHSSMRLNNRSNVSRQESNESAPKHMSSTNDPLSKTGTSEDWSDSPLANMSPLGSFTTAERESGKSELSRSALNRVRLWVTVSVGEPPTAVSAASAIQTRSAKRANLLGVERTPTERCQSSADRSSGHFLIQTAFEATQNAPVHKQKQRSSELSESSSLPGIHWQHQGSSTTDTSPCP